MSKAQIVILDSDRKSAKQLRALISALDWPAAAIVTVGVQATSSTNETSPLSLPWPPSKADVERTLQALRAPGLPA